MKCPLHCFCFILSLVCFPPLTQGIEKPADGDKTWSVHWVDNRLSVQANDAPLHELIGAVAHETGMKVIGMEKLNGSVYRNFNRLPLNEGLLALLQKANYSFQETIDQTASRYVLSILSYDAPVLELQKKTKPSTQQKKSVAVPGNVGFVPEPYRKLYDLAANGDAKALREAAVSGDSATQTIATQLLAQQDAEAAITLADEKARSDDPAKRLVAIQSLAEVDGKGALAVLGEALADPDMTVRQSAVLALHSQGSPAAIPLLTEAMRDQSENIRWLAVDLLAERGNEAIGSLNQALSSPDLPLREHARELLSQIEVD